MTPTRSSARPPRTTALVAVGAVVVASALFAVTGPRGAVATASATTIDAATLDVASAPRASRVTTDPAAVAKAHKAAKAKAAKAKAAKRRAAAAAWLDGVRRCIAFRESRNQAHIRPNYAGASGLYQFTKRTWNNYRGYSEAYLAPAHVQTERFYKSWSFWKKRYDGRWSRNPWNNPGGRQCW